MKRVTPGRDFVAKSISGLASSLERVIFGEEMARQDGFLQGVDPRAKLGATLALLVAVGFARHLSVVVLVCLSAIVLAGLSRLSAKGFAARVWLGIPLFAGVVVVPSLFTIAGTPLLTVIDTPQLRLVVTDNSLAGAALFVGRVGASVSLAVLLVSTTRWAELLRALRVVGVPESFLVVLGMTYRYLFLFLHAANNLFLARVSRTVGVTNGGEQRRWAASAAGVLVSRSMKLSGDVLLAMRARGFDGEIRTIEAPRMDDEDWLLLALSVVIAAGALLLDQRLVW